MAAAAPAQGVAAQANVGPNVVMNANAGGLGAVEDDEDGVNGGQRDILDWFYVASRILVWTISPIQIIASQTENSLTF